MKHMLLNDKSVIEEAPYLIHRYAFNSKSAYHLFLTTKQSAQLFLHRLLWKITKNVLLFTVYLTGDESD